MRRHIPGLHSVQQDNGSNLDGLFLVRVERAAYQWHRQKPFLELRFIILEPKAVASRSFSGRLYCTDRALWKLNWFLRDFDYDTELLNHLERAFLSKSRHIRACCRVGGRVLRTCHS